MKNGEKKPQEKKPPGKAEALTAERIRQVIAENKADVERLCDAIKRACAAFGPIACDFAGDAVLIASGPPQLLGRRVTFHGIAWLPDRINVSMPASPADVVDAASGMTCALKVATASFVVGTNADGTRRRRDGLPLYFFDRWLAQGEAPA